MAGLALHVVADVELKPVVYIFQDFLKMIIMILKIK